MQQFDILNSQTNIFESYFLEASAGTGKTFAIEHLFIRLLLESDPPIELKEILAVTFTREAAQEMKIRIRKKLETLLPKANRRIREALIHFDECQIFTIHGFCHRILSEFAFEANEPLDLNGSTEPDYLHEIKQTIEDFFRTGEGSFSKEISILIRKMGFNLEKLIGKLIDAVLKNEEPAPLCFPPLPKISEKNLHEDFLKLAPRYRRLNPEKYAHQMEKFSHFLEREDFLLLLEEKEWFFEKMDEANVKTKAEPIEKFSLNAPNLFDILTKKLLTSLQNYRDPDQMIKRIAKAIRKRWEKKVEKTDQWTFDDLLYKMVKASEIPSFREKIRKKYRAVIVDEFQDTDPHQWKIFEKLFLNHHYLYLVGDPKQSIYGFRSADIYTYMSAAKNFQAENRKCLDTNYRSSPKLIEALNHLFMEDPNWITLPSMPESLKYHPVKAGRKEALLDEPPLHYFGVKGTQGRERSWPTKQMEEEKIFPFISQEIIRLHQQKKISFNEMAVLIKDRYQGQRLQRHFNSWKIPSFLKRTFNLTETRGFLAMEMLLKGLMHPENKRIVKTALAFLSIENLENPFFILRKIFEEKGFSSFFSTFISEHFTEHLDPNLYLEMRQTSEILMEKQGAKIEELLYFLKELKSANPEEDERLKLWGEEGKDKVPIMTTFASKGLEFEVVFALAMASRNYLQEEDLEKNAEKMRQLYVAFTRSREKLYIPIFKEIEQKPLNPFIASPIELFFKERELPIQWVEKIPISPLQKEETQVQLIPPPKIHLNFEEEYLTSFSAMAKTSNSLLLKNRFLEQDFSKKTPHTLPLGSETGTLIHAIFEVHFQDRNVPLDQVVLETLWGTHLEGWEEVIVELVQDVLSLPIEKDFTLGSLQEGEYMQEMEFLFPQKGQLVKGFIDLVFKRGDRFFLVDWKTNWLGPSDAYYKKENLEKAMEEHDYYTQAKLYFEAVHRYVKRLYNEPLLGGAYYVFVRGKKVIHGIG